MISHQKWINRSHSNVTKHYDVIIVGGGLAGLSLSCLLGQIEGLKVACLDRETAQAHINKDERTTAISYGSSQILERAGVWQAILKQGCPIKNIEILDDDSPVLLQFLSKEVEDKPFGWIIPNVHLRTCLIDKIKQYKNVEMIAPAQAKTFNITEDKASLLCEDGTALTASLIIGADGRNSAVRDFMDVPVRQWNYKQQAVVCFVKHQNPHEHKAVEHFWPGGPFAILPMNDAPDNTHRSSLVFTEHQGNQTSLMSLSDEVFQYKVAEKFPESYGEIEIIDHKRMAYPLSLVHATEYIAPRMVLVADAAHGIHPIAGQGLNLGFRDIDTLTSLIEGTHKNGKDIGAHELLLSYQRKRRPDNMAMIVFTDTLVRLFSNNLKSVRLARKIGLRTVSRIGKAKQFFMRRAMGE